MTIKQKEVLFKQYWFPKGTKVFDCTQTYTYQQNARVMSGQHHDEFQDWSCQCIGSQHKWAPSYYGSMEPTNWTIWSLTYSQIFFLFLNQFYWLTGIHFQKWLQIMIPILHEIYFRFDSLALSKNWSMTVVSIPTNSTFEAIFKPLIQDFVGHIVNVSGLIDHILNVITLKLDACWNISSLHCFHAPV